MTYLLDANVFIQAHRNWYGLDFAPGFWTWLELSGRSGQVRSLARVRGEIPGHDAVADWVVQHKGMFVDMDPVSLRRLTEVSEWVDENYVPASVAEFLGGADCLLVAYAKAHSMTLVTHEKPEDKKKTIKEVKLPDACRAFHVPYMNTFDMLRQEKVTLVLATPHAGLLAPGLPGRPDRPG